MTRKLSIQGLPLQECREEVLDLVCGISWRNIDEMIRILVIMGVTQEVLDFACNFYKEAMEEIDARHEGNRYNSTERV